MTSLKAFECTLYRLQAILAGNLIAHKRICASNRKYTAAFGSQRFSFIMLQLPGLSVNNFRQKQVQGCGLSWCCRLQRPFHQPPPTSAETPSGTEWPSGWRLGGSHPPPTSGLFCQKFICSKSSPFLGLDRKVGEQKFKFRGLLQSLHYKPHWLILLAENPLFTSVNNLLQICSSCAPVQGWWSEPQLTPAEAKP